MTTITLNFNGMPLHCVVLDSARKQAKGLMFRKTLPPNIGALFVFATNDYHPFWMKNTLVPLDLVFLAPGGKVVKIEHGEPNNTKWLGADVKSKYVVEANRGFCPTLRVGDNVQV